MAEPQVLPAAGKTFPTHVPVVIVAGGGCGLSAGLAAHDAGATALVLERDTVCRGSTSMSAGLIPAAGSKGQRAAGIDDTPALFVADIMARTKGQTDRAVVETLVGQSAAMIDWLVEAHGIPLQPVTGWAAFGHSRPRLHQLPNAQQGEDLLSALLDACGRAGVDVVTGARVTTLFADPDGRVRGVALLRPDGSREEIGCDALVLATCGFGANHAMVAANIPEMKDATYFGPEGNRGDGMVWGAALGADLRDMSAYQGHPCLAQPQGIDMNLEPLMKGGIHVNANGARYFHEVDNVSAAALRVIAQPGRFAWYVYGEKQFRLALGSPRAREADAVGAFRYGETPEALARAIGVPPDALAATIADVQRLADTGETCPFGRRFVREDRLEGPFRAVRVTGALYHTQGGLRIDGNARVLHADGSPLPNLFAGGGAAVGISGPGREGYLPGNGLLCALGFGRIAGTNAAKLATRG